MRLRSRRSREGLHWIAARLENVSLVELPATALPEVTFNRLNEHYREVDGNFPNADLYQLLAYATALDLPGGLFIYAQGEAPPDEYRVRHAGKRLHVAALDLSGSHDELIARIDELADLVRALRLEACSTLRVA